MAEETDEGDGTTTTKTAFIEEMKWSIAQRWSALLKQFDRGGDEEARGQKWYVKDVSLLLNDWKKKLRAMSGGEENDSKGPSAGKGKVDKKEKQNREFPGTKNKA
ncbi:unnamed protein product [Sphacelaria rigidula]